MVNVRRPTELNKVKKCSEISGKLETVDKDLESSIDRAYNPVFQSSLQPEELKNNIPEQQPIDFQFTEFVHPLSISFKGLSLFLKSNQHTVLSNVSGSMEHSQITAVMGPSGAGISSVVLEIKY